MQGHDDVKELESPRKRGGTRRHRLSWHCPG